MESKSLLAQPTTYNDLVGFVESQGHKYNCEDGSRFSEILDARISSFPVTSLSRSGLDILSKFYWVEAFVFASGLKKSLFADIDFFPEHFEYFGADGPEIIKQLTNAQNVLTSKTGDYVANRALINFNNVGANPQKLSPVTSIQFYLRKGILMTTVTLNSMNLVSGFIGGLIKFGVLHQIMAASIGAYSGNLLFNIGSLYLLEKDKIWSDASKPVKMYSLGDTSNLVGKDWDVIAQEIRSGLTSFINDDEPIFDWEVYETENHKQFKF